MPSIYITENLHNKRNGIMPWRYVGSDQKDDPAYLGSSKQLKLDVQTIGAEQFVKTTLRYYDSIDNKELRRIEADYLQSVNAKYDESYYNQSQTYSPGCGVKGMKHKTSKPRSQAWKDSRSGWNPSDETRQLWSEQRTGRTASEEQRKARSARTSGAGNVNAIEWDIISPEGIVTRVKGLRGYCREHNLPFEAIYHSKQGWKSIKYGAGKGGGRKKTA